MVCSTDRSKAVVPVLDLLFVALWFILRGDLLYVFPCVILFFFFSVLLVLRLPRLGKRELILVLFVRLSGLCLFRFVGFLFLLGSGKGCGLWLWHSLDFSLTFFDKFRSSLMEYNLTVKVGETTDLDINAQQITDSLIYAAEMSIPNKVVTVRLSESSWITSKVKQLIRKRKRLHKRFKRTNKLVYWESYKIIHNLAVKELRNSKKKYFDKLDELLSTSTTDSKIFWKTAKQFLNLGKSSSSIPTLKLNDYYAKDDLKKANLLNTYFISQSNVIDDNISLLPKHESTQYSLNVIQITCQDVRDVLRNLNISVLWSRPNQSSTS